MSMLVCVNAGELLYIDLFALHVYIIEFSFSHHSDITDSSVAQHGEIMNLFLYLLHALHCNEYPNLNPYPKFT